MDDVVTVGTYTKDRAGMAVRITESSHTVEGVLSRIRKAATLKEKQTQREKRRGKGSGPRGSNQ